MSDVIAIYLIYYAIICVGSFFIAQYGQDMTTKHDIKLRELATFGLLTFGLGLAFFFIYTYRYASIAKDSLS